MIHVGIIGTSKIAQTLCSVFQMFDDISIEAIYSRKLETAQIFAEKFHIQRMYTSLQDMLQNTNINLVYIASPNVLHAKHTEECLKHGKHVLCEKPVTLNEKDLHKLILIAEESGCFFIEAITTPFMPNYHILQKKLLSISTVHLINCNLSQYSSRYQELMNGKITNVFNSEMGGGALYDLGVYCLHFLYGLFGYPKRMRIECVTHSTGIDTSGVIVMTYTDKIAVASYGKDSCGKASARIQYEDGYMDIDGSCSRVNALYESNKAGYVSIGVETKAAHHWYEVKAVITLIKEQNWEMQRQLWRESLAVCRMVDELHRQLEGEAI